MYSGSLKSTTAGKSKCVVKVDPFSKKDWCDVKAPASLKNRENDSHKGLKQKCTWWPQGSYV